jgi:hypothetical protein
MEEHPNRQPRRAETVHSGDDYDGECDEQFESGWIYDGTSVVLYTKKDAKRCRRIEQEAKSEGLRKLIGHRSFSISHLSFLSGTEIPRSRRSSNEK